jgi:hypothetical protein
MLRLLRMATGKTLLNPAIVAAVLDVLLIGLAAGCGVRH